MDRNKAVATIRALFNYVADCDIAGKHEAASNALRRAGRIAYRIT